MADTEAREAPQETDEEREQREWEEERAAAASAQNLPPGAVPETRPQAMVTNEAPPESELTKQLREGGALPEEQEPHGKENYDRAASKKQMREAEKNSRSEGIMVGNGVRATAGPHKGRIFAVTRVIKHGSAADMVRTASGDPAQLYNTPSGLELRAVGDERDGELVVLEDDDLEKAKLEKLNEGWRGTRAGRRH